MTLLAMERRLLTTLSEKVTELIQSSLTDSITSALASQISSNGNIQQPAARGIESMDSQSDLTNEPLENSRLLTVSPGYQRCTTSDLLNRPDKVVHILNGWKIKYSGVGVSVDNFIYRVETLTKETLEGNFTVLCKNASVLFEGKANEFYWRYHKAHGEVVWDAFCAALRQQFRPSRDDGDIEELIRNTKQKPNETFDCFYETISGLVDQLEVPWTPHKLVRVLKNNLRPEIRHELLNIEIRSVSELREICRRREDFLADIKRYSGYARGSLFKREVSELNKEQENMETEIESENEVDIEAFSLLCWNCRKEGHRYQDCVSERRIFCYGCGTANTYKPNCSKCSKNYKTGMSKSPFRQKASITVRSQATMTDK